MAVTFPDNPVLNQSYQAENGLTYVWDGEKWSSQGSYNIDKITTSVRTARTLLFMLTTLVWVLVRRVLPPKNVHVYGTVGILIEDSSEDILLRHRIHYW